MRGRNWRGGAALSVRAGASVAPFGYVVVLLLSCGEFCLMREHSSLWWA